MATNFDLHSSSSSVSGGDNSSGSEEYDLLHPNRKIDLSYRELTSEQLDMSLQEISGCQNSVEKLLLYNNRLESFPAITIRFKNLSVLDLSNNMLRSVPDCISQMTSLVQVFLRNNLLSEADFPKSLSSLIGLKDINLSGNRFNEIPAALLDVLSLRNLFLGGNKILEVPSSVKKLTRLRILYLGGNLLESLPSEICHLRHLHALILCDNRLRSLPDSICALRRLQCLQLHRNQLTTLPHGLIHIENLAELSLRDNPLVVRFVRELTHQPSTLMELAGRVITVKNIPFSDAELPATLCNYLSSSHLCVNPICKGVYFNDRVETVRFVDFCGKYKVPLMQYLCSSRCRSDHPAVAVNAEEESKLKRVLLG